MKFRFLLLGLLLFSVSCSLNESLVLDNNIDVFTNELFFATINEQPDSDTKVYSDNQLRIYWNENDRISIFSKNTYNQQYCFLGQNGDNAGSFRRMSSDESITGSELDKSYAVYPYKEENMIDYQGVITTSIPSVQYFKEFSFGIGANTMVSSTDDYVLRFKNLGGYLSLKFFGEGVSVSSITLKSNNGELISGKCTVSLSNGIPVSSLVIDDASDEVTLDFDTSYVLPANEDDAVIVIIVLHPVSLIGGFTVTVNSFDGGVFEKSWNKPVEIARSSITRMGALEVVPEYIQPKNNVIYYTTSDGEIITPYSTDVFGANIVSNEYVNDRGVLTFDGDVSSIGDYAFFDRQSLTSITIPASVTRLGLYAFKYCDNLMSITSYAVTPPDGKSNMFDYTNECPIYVPGESVLSYRHYESGWFNYAFRIQAIGNESGKINGHPYVDMGNGLYWATMNLGANEPGDSGDFYAWGEITPKYRYNESTYNFDYDFEDAATENWGGSWRLPTVSEWTTFFDLDQYRWDWNKNYPPGCIITNIETGHSIFLPNTGYYKDNSVYDYNYGWYWSSSTSENNNDAVAQHFAQGEYGGTRVEPRYLGLAIRPVSD